MSRVEAFLRIWPLDDAIKIELRSRGERSHVDATDGRDIAGLEVVVRACGERRGVIWEAIGNMLYEVSGEVLAAPGLRAVLEIIFVDVVA